MFRKLLAGSALVLCSSAAFAIPIGFTVSYDVSARDQDPGLVVQTQNLAGNPFSFILDIDGVTTFTTSLFRIWTNESTLNNDDYTEYPIEVDFSFTAPQVGGVTASGTTSGGIDDFILIYWTGQGELRWDAPFWDYNFGSGGLLRISLTNVDFNEGPYDILEGYKHGADIGATFELVRAPTSVPEPGTLALLGAGLAGIGLMGRRRAQP